MSFFVLERKGIGEGEHGFCTMLFMILETILQTSVVEKMLVQQNAVNPTCMGLDRY